jgi:hypothetical protein
MRPRAKASCFGGSNCDSYGCHLPLEGVLVYPLHVSSLCILFMLGSRVKTLAHVPGLVVVAHCLVTLLVDINGKLRFHLVAAHLCLRPCLDPSVMLLSL